MVSQTGQSTILSAEAGVARAVNIAETLDGVLVQRTGLSLNGFVDILAREHTVTVRPSAFSQTTNDFLKPTEGVSTVATDDDHPSNFLGEDTQHG